MILYNGTIKDAQSNNAILTLPDPGKTNSLSANKAIEIDNISPSISFVYESEKEDLDYLNKVGDLDIYWGIGSDSLSDIIKYEVAIGSSLGGVDIINWTDVSSFNSKSQFSITISNLELIDGVTYYASMRATDNAGNISAVMIGDGITVDLTAPSSGFVNDGLSTDIAYTSSLNSLSGNWTGFIDAASGITDYQYAIGTTSNGTDVKDWASNGLDTSFTYTGYELINTQVYYISVKAIDMVGNVSDTVSSNGVIADHENPGVGLVLRDKAFTNTDTVYASWSGFADSLSGITEYEYAVGTTRGSTDLLDWTSNGDANKKNVALGILLKDQTSYYVSVRAVDNVGNRSAFASSDEIIACLLYTSPSPRDA